MNSPLCDCHGEPMEWDSRSYRRSGIWRCVIARRERQRAYWNRTDGGYVVRRRRHLAEERGRVVARLSELEQEALSLAES